MKSCLGQVILESYYLLSLYPLALLVLFILCPKYGLNVFAIFLQNHVHPHIHIHTYTCAAHGCPGVLQKRWLIYTYAAVWYIYIWEHTLSYESISIYLHYFSPFHTILPCGFKVTLLFLLFSLCVSLCDHPKEEVEEIIWFLLCEKYWKIK